MILNERTPGPRARPDQFASIDQAQEMGAPIDKQGLRQKRVLLIRESEEGEDVVSLRHSGWELQAQSRMQNLPVGPDGAKERHYVIPQQL